MILYVILANSGSGYLRSGMQITLIAALKAALIPASESSRTIVSDGLTSSFWHAFKNISGSGLPLMTSSPQIESSKYRFNPANLKI